MKEGNKTRKNEKKEMKNEGETRSYDSVRGQEKRGDIMKRESEPKEREGGVTRSCFFFRGKRKVEEKKFRRRRQRKQT